MNHDRISEGIANIYGTGFFEYVSIRAYRGPGKNILKIKVRENRPLAVRGGFRYDLQERANGFCELVDENVMGLGYSLNARLHYGDKRYSGRLQLRTARVLTSYISAEGVFEAGHREFSYTSPETGERTPVSYDSRAGNIIVGSQSRRLGNVSLGMRFRYFIDQTGQSDNIKGVCLRSLV